MSAASRAGDLLRRGVRPADLTAARISRRLNAGPRNGVELPRSGSTFSRLAQCTTKAAPTAVPASCGAEGYEHVGEIARLPDQLIGHAIECDAAGNAQLVERHFALEAPDQRHDRRVRRFLQRRRDIGMSRQNLHALVPRRTEQGLHSASTWPIESRSPPGLPHNPPCRRARSTGIRDGTPRDCRRLPSP